MTALLDTIIGMIGAHRQWAYALVFLLSFAESLLIVGTVVPGSVIILGISALVPSGAVSLWPLISATILGLFGGDTLSYWVGRRYYRRILSLWPFNRHPELIARGEAFFRRHGSNSVFLSRFVRGPHAVVPMLAGIMRMSPRRFLVANLLSAVTWVPLHILTGVLLGASLSLADAVAGRLAAFLALFLVTLWLIVWTVRFALRRGIPRIAAAQERLLSWASGEGSWTRRQVLALLDPARPEVRILTLLAGILIGAAWTFFGILEDVATGDPLVRMDTAVYHFLQALRVLWVDRVMIVFTELGDTTVTVGVTVAVLAWLSWKRAWHTAAYWLGAIAFAGAFTMALKVVLHVSRPIDLYAGWSAFSFPSSHTIVSTVMYGFLTIIIVREIRPQWRGAIVMASALFVALIAFSRLYLGAHWLSDVVGGLMFGLAWVALLGMAYLRHERSTIHAQGLLAVVCVALALTGGIHVYRQYHKDLRFYAVRYTVQTLPASAWWTEDWKDLPARRTDLGGAMEEPLTVQWAGRLDEIRQRLIADGWQIPRSWSVTTALAWLTPAPDPIQLPVLPLLHEGRPSSLVLIHPVTGEKNPASRLVFRLWRSDLQVRNVHREIRRIWIGSVIKEEFYRPFAMITLSRKAPFVLKNLRDLETRQAVVRIVARVSTLPGRDWDGKLLLVHDPSLSVRSP